VPSDTPPSHEEAGEAGAASGEVVPFPSRPRPDDGEQAGVPKLRDVVGEVLREERHRQGRTLADVAEAAAVSLQYLSEVERGTKEVSSDLLDAVHTALGLDLATVLERATRRLAVGSERRGVLRMAA
jgi:hypothetical protein